MDHKLVKERLSSTGTSPILLDFKCRPHRLVDALLRGIRCCILSALKEPPASLLYRQSMVWQDWDWGLFLEVSLGRLSRPCKPLSRTVFVSDLVSGQWSSSCIDLGCSIDASDGERDGMQAWQQKQQVVSASNLQMWQVGKREATNNSRCFWFARLGGEPRTYLCLQHEARDVRPDAHP